MCLPSGRSASIEVPLDSRVCVLQAAAAQEFGCGIRFLVTGSCCQLNPQDALSTALASGESVTAVVTSSILMATKRISLAPPAGAFALADGRKLAIWGFQKSRSLRTSRVTDLDALQIQAGLFGFAAIRADGSVAPWLCGREQHELRLTKGARCIQAVKLTSQFSPFAFSSRVRFARFWGREALKCLLGIHEDPNSVTSNSAYMDVLAVLWCRHL